MCYCMWRPSRLWTFKLNNVSSGIKESVFIFIDNSFARVYWLWHFWDSDLFLKIFIMFHRSIHWKWWALAWHHNMFHKYVLCCCFIYTASIRVVWYFLNPLAELCIIHKRQVCRLNGLSINLWKSTIILSPKNFFSRGQPFIT